MKDLTGVARLCVSKLNTTSLKGKTAGVASAPSVVKSQTLDVKSGFVVVDADEKDESTIAVVPRPMFENRARPRGVKMKELSIILPFRNAVSSGAGAALTTITGCSPSIATSDWSSLVALYDEVKVESGEVHFQILQTSGASAITTGLMWGVAYDPIENSAYGSIQTLASASQKQFGSLITTGGYATASKPGGPAPTNKHGLFTFHFKCPKGASIDSGSSLNITGQWGDTTSAADTWGFIKPYVEGLGGTAVITMDMLVFLHCKFRSRT